MDIYRLNPTIVHHQLHVSFQGEEIAPDMEGVTMELFTTAFTAKMNQYFEGRSHRTPANNLNFILDVRSSLLVRSLLIFTFL